MYCICSENLKEVMHIILLLYTLEGRSTIQTKENLGKLKLGEKYVCVNMVKFVFFKRLVKCAPLLNTFIGSQSAIPIVYFNILV